MQVASLARRILPLFGTDELKASCKAWGLKGFSKHAKAGLVDFIAIQRSEEELATFMAGAGKAKLVEVVEQAASLLRGDMPVNETLVSLNAGEGAISAEFKGLRWTTSCTVQRAGIDGPDPDVACDCRTSADGGFCVHFWTIVLFAIAGKTVEPDPGAWFETLTGGRVSRLAREVPRKLLHAFLPRDVTDDSLDDILASSTTGNRLATARRELGLVQVPGRAEPASDAAGPSQAGVPDEAGGTRKAAKKPAKKPAKKAPKQVEPVSIEWKRCEPGPPAILEPRFFRGEGEARYESSIYVLIDEARKIVIHENCPDFEIRLMREHLLCKHLLATFLSVDEQVAKRLLSSVRTYTFMSFGRPDTVQPAGLSESVQAVTPEVRMVDGELDKDAILTWLLDRDASTMDEITTTFGPGAASRVREMVGEGIIEHAGRDTYQAR